MDDPLQQSHSNSPSDEEAEEFRYESSAPRSIIRHDVIQQGGLGLSVTPTAAYPSPFASVHALNKVQGDDTVTVVEICRACQSGNLQELQDVMASVPSGKKFSLVNSPHPHSALYPLHYAASRGHLHICSYLVNTCGAMLLEDSSGESPIHISAYKGHAAILRLLIDSASSSPLEAAQAADFDGWTPLHNACSRGYLDIVKYLVQEVGVDPNMGSALGYTPLMNAASKGNLPIVHYLLSREQIRVDPFKRNKYGEAAYDVATTAEYYISEILAAAEAEIWRESRQNTAESHNIIHSYNPLAVHVSMAVVLHENQRLDIRLVKSNQRPQFSASAISKNDARSPFTLPPSYHGINPTDFHLPVFRSDLGLPATEAPFQISLPSIAISYLTQQSKVKRPSRSRTTSAESQRRPTPHNRIRSASSVATQASVDEASSFYAADALLPGIVPPSAERSHFWTSDWYIDLTSPSVDPSEGWEYSPSFDSQPEDWHSEPPPELSRLLNQSTNLTIPGTQTKWVRRRKWVRVMRRRLDRPPLPFADLNGPDIALFPASPGFSGSIPANPLSDPSDYLARARFKAGVHHKLGKLPREADEASLRSGKTVMESETAHATASRAEARRLIARLEGAVAELRIGLLSDEDHDRIQQASALLETYASRLEEIHREVASNIDISDQEAADALQQEEGNLSPPGTATLAPADYFTSTSVAASANRPPDLTPHLSQASDFRVPTRDSPMKARWPTENIPVAVSTSPEWERDQDAAVCRRCSAPFTLFKRKHHCRRCGKICCAACCSNYDRLAPSEIVTDPASHDPINVNFNQRTCNACHAELTRPSANTQHGLQLTADLLSTVMTPLSGPGSPLAASEVSSQLSVLSECPVCGFALGALGNQADQEEHVRKCLEAPQAVTTGQRYLVFKLGPSTLVGTDCEICFEPFETNNLIARLPCFCFYHKACLAAWLNRGGNCPVHGRD